MSNFLNFTFMLASKAALSCCSSVMFCKEWNEMACLWTTTNLVNTEGFLCAPVHSILLLEDSKWFLNIASTNFHLILLTHSCQLLHSLVGELGRGHYRKVGCWVLNWWDKVDDRRDGDVGRRGQGFSWGKLAVWSLDGEQGDNWRDIHHPGHLHR